ncbi:Derlin-3 [Mortierella sp. GBA35]|nr:Derlin-3 [Mortierella sp. GBA35]
MFVSLLGGCVSDLANVSRKKGSEDSRVFHLGLVDRYHLYFNPALVFQKHQVWRIVTAFLYYGEEENLGFEILYTFNIYYLEKEWFSERTLDFVWAYFLSAVTLLIASTLHSLAFVAVELHLVFFQVWYLHIARRTASQKIVVFSWLLHIFLVSVSYYYSIFGRFTALAFGALYHFLESVFPTWRISRGVRLLKTPDFL